MGEDRSRHALDTAKPPVMLALVKAVITAVLRPFLEPHLPAWLEVVWVETVGQAKAEIGDAEIACLDLIYPGKLIRETIETAGTNLKWLSTSYAGLDIFPLDVLRSRNVTLTNGVGVTAIAVAEYAVLTVLAAAKRFDEVIRAHDRQEWLRVAPGKIELFGTKALVIGFGTIGRMIGERLAPFGVAVTGVTRSGRDNTLNPDMWEALLGQFDWVILAAPSTDATRAMIGARQLAAMKHSAWLINMARGDIIDDAALAAALNNGEIAGAVLDPTHPEPLPAGHPLWSARNMMITMHLSGRSQTSMMSRGAAQFLKNLAAFGEGGKMENIVDLEAGY